MTSIFNQPGEKWVAGSVARDYYSIVRRAALHEAAADWLLTRARRVAMASPMNVAIEEGMSYTIPPGHDAWVEGNDPFVGFEMMSAEEYAKPKS